MAFEGLTDKLQAAFKKLSGKGKLSEADVREAMREVRMALLEADVNFVVVKDFIKRVTERAVGQEILSSLTPAQMVIKIVNEELTGLMGGANARLTHASAGVPPHEALISPTGTPSARCSARPSTCWTRGRGGWCCASAASGRSRPPRALRWI